MKHTPHPDHVRECAQCLATDLLHAMRDLGIHPQVMTDALEVAFRAMIEGKRVFEDNQKQGAVH